MRDIRQLRIRLKSGTHVRGCVSHFVVGPNLMSLRRFSSLVLCVLTFFLTIQAFGQATCTQSSTNRTVTICTPANGATVGTTFHVNAGTTDSATIQYIELYVENVRYVIQHTNYLDATVTVPAGTNQKLVVQAHDSGNMTFSSTIHVNVSTTVSYSISPTNPSVEEGATEQFSASTGSNWSASCGTISSAGLFTAPLRTGTCTVTGTATDGSGSASTSVAVTSPIAITPSSATTATGSTQQFSANASVVWSASCGTISSSGLFTAPGSAGTCTITATSASGTAYTATATDTVTASTTGQNYTTWKYDNARDGLNSTETILTPTLVSSSSFGEIASVTVDGKVWAQPLYVSGVTIGGTTHNVVYVATSNDSVYAIDGDNGEQLWKAALLPPGETAANGDTIHSAVTTYVGITGTPVIDTTTGTLYAVTETVTSSNSYYHRLHALDLTTGAEKFGAPIIINYSGFESIQQLQRPALLLANGNVYVAFGSNGDYAPYHGWIFAYSASNLSQVAVWNSTPEADAGAVWMGGAGPAADANGNLFFVTANGDWDGTQQFGQSVMELSPGLGVLDYFTPINHNTQSKDDKDLGSGGITLLPTFSGTYPHEAVNCSKLDDIYILDRDHLGEIGSSQDNVVQQVSGQLGGTSGLQYTDRCFSNPAFWNNNLYFIGNNDVVKQFSFNPSTGMMSTTPVYKDTHEYVFPGAQPVVSSNGNANAIVWAIDFGNGSLHAYDATNVSKELYNSPSLGGGVKFTVPTVINGHVYVGLYNRLAIFGTQVAPSCTPPTSAGAKICAPTAGGSYSSPVQVSASGTAPSGTTLNRLELWIDGKKFNNYFSNQIRTTVPSASGKHSLNVVEVDSTGAYSKSSPISFTVK